MRGKEGFSLGMCSARALRASRMQVACASQLYTICLGFTYHFLYILRALMALITLQSALISGLISRWPLIRISLQLSASGAREILKSALGGWLNI